MSRTKVALLSVIAVAVACSVIYFWLASHRDRYVDIDSGKMLSLPIKKSRENTSAMTSDDITIERFSEFSYSFGNAIAVYWEMRISADGEVVYSLVDQTVHPPNFSRSRFLLSEAELASLLAKLRKEGLVQLRDLYDSGVADADWIHITLKCNSMTKNVSCNQHVPVPVANISRFIHAEILEPHRMQIQNAEPITKEEANKLGLPR